jgi:Rrf2 family protein
LGSSVDTNPVVIRRLLSALVKAKLVSTRKGATGGFTLAADPAKITLLDIYRAIEPCPSQGLSRFAPNRRCPVGAKIEEILHAMFGRAQAAMEAELGRVTLDMVERQLHSVCTAKR